MYINATFYFPEVQGPVITFGDGYIKIQTATRDVRVNVPDNWSPYGMNLPDLCIN